MNQVSYDVTFEEPRSRLTTAFRMFLAIPHFVVMYFWGIAAQVVAFIQWFVIVFTGKRNEGMFTFTNGYIGYATRVMNYAGLMFDEYPKFGTDPSGVPMTYGLDYDQPASRLTNGLRFLWIIPAAIIGFVLILAAEVIALAQWFVVVITGKANRGMWEFSRKVHNFAIQLNVYGFLMTDRYPKYAQASATAA